MASRIIRHKRLTSHHRSVKCKAAHITKVLSSGAWKGKTCFLIGGGPSIKGFDFNLIKNELTIGVNKAFTEYPVTVNYAMDMRLYDIVSCGNVKDKKIHQQWLEYKGIKVFAQRSKKYKFDESVYVVNSLRRKALSFNLDEGIWEGNNSGFGALMLAIGLGATRIGLLGYDLKVRKTHKNIETHWHGGYGLDRADTFQSKLDKFRGCFTDFAPIIKQQGIEVVNLNPDSALDCFPKKEFKMFLE